jgi:hypothetical protein
MYASLFKNSPGDTHTSVVFSFKSLDKKNFSFTSLNTTLKYILHGKQKMTPEKAQSTSVFKISRMNSSRQ